MKALGRSHLLQCRPSSQPVTPTRRWPRAWQPTALAARTCCTSTTQWIELYQQNLSICLDRLRSCNSQEQHVLCVDATLKELSQAQSRAQHSYKNHENAAVRKDALQAYIYFRQLEQDLCNSDSVLAPLQHPEVLGDACLSHLCSSVLTSLVLGGTRASSSYAIGWNEEQKQQLLQKHQEDDVSLVAELEQLWLLPAAGPSVQLEQQELSVDDVLTEAVHRQGGSLCLQLDLATVQFLLQHHPDAGIRHQVQQMALEPRVRRTAALLAGLQLARFRIAQHYGFHCYAELALLGSLAGQPGSSIAFLQELAEAIRPHAEQEVARCCQQLGLGAEDITAADWERLQRLVQQQQQQQQQEGQQGLAQQVEPYLDLDTCLSGISSLLEQLLGLQLQQQEVTSAEAWAPGLRKYSVTEVAGRRHLGALYMDTSAGYGTRMLHFGSLSQGGAVSACPAPGINRSAFQHAQQGDDFCCGQQPPVVAVGLQSAGQLGGGNLELGLWELLHELGHALHFILSAQSCKHFHFHGCRCPMELLEVPSHIFERLAMNPTSLQTICRHRATGEVMPEHLAAALAERIAQHWYSPVQYQQQVLTVLLDQLLHAVPDKLSARDVQQLWQDVWDTYSAAPSMPVTCQQARALHKVAADHGRAYGYMFAWYLAAAFWAKELLPVLDQLGHVVGGSARCSQLLELLSDGAQLQPKALVEKYWFELVSAEQDASKGGSGKWQLRVDPVVLKFGLFVPPMA